VVKEREITDSISVAASEIVLRSVVRNGKRQRPVVSAGKTKNRISDLQSLVAFYRLTERTQKLLPIRITVKNSFASIAPTLL